MQPTQNCFYEKSHISAFDGDYTSDLGTEAQFNSTFIHEVLITNM